MTDNSADALRPDTPLPSASNGSTAGSGGNVADLDAALEQVITAARTHLAAVRAADGERDDDGVWNAYVALNNASHGYDELLKDVFGEVTPWDLEVISADDIDRAGIVTTLEPQDEVGHDPHPRIVSVRQRRDYRVPSVTALLRVAAEGRAPAADGEVLEPIDAVGEAVLELLQSGDGSLAMLDIPELDPLDGVVVVAEVVAALSTEEHDGPDAAGAFELAGDDRPVGRLDERTLLDTEDSRHPED
jgi:hypothetical protein